MNLKERLKRDKDTNFVNIIYKPWFDKFVYLGLATFFVIMAFILYPYLRPASIEDCANYNYLEEYNRDYKLVKWNLSSKLTDDDYEAIFEYCESERKKFPEKFKSKYKDAVKQVNLEIKRLEDRNKSK